ncbi:hypothetical protein A6A06_26335 [Streptomyces sp. CB02923]|uniref:SRPBCC family protein n=1 Tax=Streptomyces sp. CB02923 TaxID=1718985 RepID=UPI00093DFF94|nr:SRPBCC family protein [Streptomyces sp. CB02923]OKH99104.1 hypothetical protein A6A06_26335 [Streptomyces sp. CB02923]
MASTSVSRVLPASPQKVWDLIGGFDALPDWLPYIPESTALEGGRVRKLANLDGDVVIERLVGFDEAERHYTYAILEAPFPVTGYLSTLRVHSVDDRDDLAEVQWSGRFTPDGVSDTEAEELFAGIYADGLDALHQALAA